MLSLRRLHLSVLTDQGVFGRTLDFTKGLNVLRADNSRGKSTCMHAIVYALGLEAILGPKHDAPFTAAMLHHLTDERGKELKVLESDVFLEVSNSDNSALTIRRSVKGRRNRNLVSTWRGAAMTDPKSEYQRADYFVREPGAAISESGFHQYLAQFLGWDLPIVTRVDGNTCPLYLEVIFPLMIVEQKAGWSAIQASTPSYGIREPSKRALEFVLGLQGYDVIAQREAKIRKQRELRARWSELIRQQERILRDIGGALHGIDASKITDIETIDGATVYVWRNDKWIDIEAAIAQIAVEILRTAHANIPLAGQDSGLNERLSELQSELHSKERVSDLALNTLSLERSQLDSIDRRIAALEEDLRKSKDAQKLRRLGSNLGLAVAKSECPTCHQPIADSVEEQISVGTLMSLEENIEFISAQLSAFKEMRANSAAALEAKEIQFSELQRSLRETRKEIRATKETLESPADTPSVAAISRRLSLEAALDNVKKAADDFVIAKVDLRDISQLYATVTAELKLIPPQGLSQHDLTKLKDLQATFISLERDFGFSSFSPDTLEISLDTYKPTRANFEMMYETSASDNVRTIWAYLLSLLELARTYPEMHHPGFVIFDEPRQQDTARESFEQLFRRAYESERWHQQVLFATSQAPDAIDALHRQMPFNYMNFAGRLLTKTDAPFSYLH